MAEDPSAELTERELRFVAEYVDEPNATRAYMRAYNSTSYNAASVAASDLLEKPRVKAAVAAYRKTWLGRKRASFQRTVSRLAEIAFADPDDLFEPDPQNDGLPKPRAWATIRPAARKNILTVKLKRRKLKGSDDCLYEIEELEYKMLDPMAALDKLCKYLGIEKGALTADELRGIIYGAAAVGAHVATDAKAGATERPAGVPGGDGAADAPLHPDE